MRIADILGLALSALWQQKARTLLTTLGVIFGSFVLAASLSIGHGVQETIERESRRSTQLRKVDVQPQWQGRESDVPAEQVRVEGRLNDARRQRIRTALVNRKKNFNPHGPRLPLTRDRLRLLADIEHVEAVIPIVSLNGWAIFGPRSELVTMGSAEPDSPSLRSRIVSGRFFDSLDEPSAVVTELLLYQAGMTDDAAIDGIVGKKVRLEFRPERRAFGLGMYLLKPDGVGTTREESSALEKIKNQLAGRLISSIWPRRSATSWAEPSANRRRNKRRCMARRSPSPASCACPPRRNKATLGELCRGNRPTPTSCCRCGRPRTFSSTLPPRATSALIGRFWSSTTSKTSRPWSRRSKKWT